MIKKNRKMNCENCGDDKVVILLVSQTGYFCYKCTKEIKVTNFKNEIMKSVPSESISI